MKKQTETFASVMGRFAYRHDLRSVFDDFLTMAICSFGQNPATGKSYDEDLYMQTVARYKGDKLAVEFPKLLACLIREMEDRWDSSEGFDVLGDYYNENLTRKGSGQFFTPWHVCTMMAQMGGGTSDEKKRLRVLDPACGSGRMLMAAHRNAGQANSYYGVDIDLMCTKMCAINFFLSGMFGSEAMCADALLREDFKVSYRVSLLPFGLFRIQEKEKSELWHLMKNSWDKIQAEPKILYEGTAAKYSDGPQLKMF